MEYLGIGEMLNKASPGANYLLSIQHPMSQEGQKDHQGYQPPEPLPVHTTTIQKARSVQVHQSWTERLKNSFYLKVIRLLNSHH
jgi:ribosomal protein S10